MINSLETAYSRLVWNSHPDTVNHQVIFADGSTDWQYICPNEKAYYQRKLDEWHQNYASFLTESATDH
jgi:hypothetical protein